MEVGDLLAAVTAVDEVGDHAAAQRPRPVEGDEGDEVFEPLGLELFDEVGHAARLHLEDAGRFAGRQHGARLGVGEGDGIDVDVEAAVLFDVGEGIADDG